MTTVVDESNLETPYDENMLERARSRKYARSIIKEALNLINDMEEAKGKTNSESEADNESRLVQTPATLNEALAAFVRTNYPEVLQNFTAGPVPEAIQLEAKRLLTPRDKPIVVANTDSATKVMLESYATLDETGQNKMWLGACQSVNKKLNKGIVDLRKVQDNNGSKVAKLVKELLTHAE